MIESGFSIYWIWISPILLLQHTINMRVKLMVQPNPIQYVCIYTHTRAPTLTVLALTGEKPRRLHHLERDWSVALSVIVSPSSFVCLVRFYPVLFLSVAAVGLEPLSPHWHAPPFSYPSSDSIPPSKKPNFFNLYIHQKKVIKTTPTEKPRHY